MTRDSDAPSDCALAIALPFDRAAFVADADDAGKDFVRSWSLAARAPAGDLWPAYARILEYAKTVGDEVRDLGGLVAAPATLQAWSRLVHSRRVVALIAHWAARTEGDRIEFADGLVTVDQLVSVLPPDYNGVLDLTTCHSTRAIRWIKRARPGCTVLANRGETDLDIRLAVYRQILRVLQRERTSYVEAASKVHLALLEAT